MRLVDADMSLRDSDKLMTKYLNRIKDYCKRHITEEAKITGNCCAYHCICALAPAGVCGNLRRSSPSHWFEKE